MKKILLSLFASLLLLSCTNHEAKVTTEGCAAEPSQVMEEIIMARRSIRNYKDIAVSRDTLERIMKCGLNAPNGKGIQAEEYSYYKST